MAAETMDIVKKALESIGDDLITKTDGIDTALRSTIERDIRSNKTPFVTNINSNIEIAVKNTLQKCLGQAVTDVIGLQGVNDILKAITSVPSENVVSKLAKAALDEINPELWVFQDPDFDRLTKLVRAKRAIENGELEMLGDDDDNKGIGDHELLGDSGDCIFLAVYENETCEKGYSMFALSEKIKSLVDDPVSGYFVRQILQELYECSIRNVDEEEPSLETDISNLALAEHLPRTPQSAKAGQPFVMIVEGVNPILVDLSNMKIYNVKGSSIDNRRNWKKLYYDMKPGTDKNKCFILESKPNVGHSPKGEKYIVGGHMWYGNADYHYILPICKTHNYRGRFDKPTNDEGEVVWLKTGGNTQAVRIDKHSDITVSQLIGFSRIEAKSDRSDGGHRVIIKPNHITNSLLVDVHKISLEFAKDPISIVFKEVSGTVLGKLASLIESEGNIAKDSSTFYHGVQSGLAEYKNECLGQTEQARRKNRLIEEIDKVLSSRNWKERIAKCKVTAQ